MFFPSLSSLVPYTVGDFKSHCWKTPEEKYKTQWACTEYSWASPPWGSEPAHRPQRIHDNSTLMGHSTQPTSCLQKGYIYIRDALFSAFRPPTIHFLSRSQGIAQFLTRKYQSHTHTQNPRSLARTCQLTFSLHTGPGGTWFGCFDTIGQSACVFSGRKALQPGTSWVFLREK